jgi:hypothetical protein
MSFCRVSRLTILLGATAIGLLTSANAHASTWSFGLMSDTQWIGSVGAANNPGTSAVSIVNQVNQQFINKGVKFVIQDGDLVDKYSAANEQVRASAAQPLYNAGIGFMPLRGNHDAPNNGTASLQTVQNLYPQMTGSGNAFGASNFKVNAATGSYAFDYNNTRFVMLDQFTGAPTSGTLSGTNIGTQLNWLNSTLSTTTNPDPGVTNSFVIGHKNLIGGNHVDNLFGANPSSNPAVQNEFYSILAQNNVDAYIGGHDHMMQVDRVLSPDGATTVTQIISGSDSNKFYIPAGNAENPNGGKTLAQQYGRTEDVISQSLYDIGYWIFTVDGATINAVYYAAASYATKDGNEYLMAATPPKLDFKELYSFNFTDGNVSATPLPSSWAMLLAGFAGVGFIAYRRKSKPALIAA